MCVCYTNHALDSFLEDLLGKGITDLVRIGGGSKNAKLDPYQLRSRQAQGFDRAQNRQFAILKEALEESQAQIDQIQRTSGLNSKPDKRAVVAWLEDEDLEAFQELQMPEGGDGGTVVGRRVRGCGGFRLICDRSLSRGIFVAAASPSECCLLYVVVLRDVDYNSTPSAFLNGPTFLTKRVLILHVFALPSPPKTLTLLTTLRNALLDFKRCRHV